jgi:hypothetical protein
MTHHLFARFDYDGFTPFLRTGYQAVSKRVATEEWGNNFIWCAEVHKEAKEPLYVSAFHYGPKLSRMVAQCIVDGIVTRQLIPDQAGTSGSQPMESTD